MRMKEVPINPSAQNMTLFNQRSVNSRATTNPKMAAITNVGMRIQSSPNHPASLAKPNPVSHSATGRRQSRSFQRFDNSHVSVSAARTPISTDKRNTLDFIICEKPSEQFAKLDSRRDFSFAPNFCRASLWLCRRRGNESLILKRDSLRAKGRGRSAGLRPAAT